MDQQKDNRGVAAIVPAYNESERIGRVLSILTSYPRFREVIVVDDGSTDNTAEIAKKYPVRFVKNAQNKGKGYAMDVGVSLTGCEYIFFADADVTGLTHEIIDDILKSVLEGEVDMSIGMRNRSTYYLHFIIFFTPLLGGERSLTKELWLTLPSYYKHRFRVETGLNFYARYYGKGFDYKVYEGLSQTIKEKKLGLFKGLTHRLLMSVSVILTLLKLQFAEIPKSARNLRISLIIALQSMVGMMLGALFFVAIYWGPREFLYNLFSDAILEDKSTPLVDFLFLIVRLISINGLLVIGAILVVANLVIFLSTVKRLTNISTDLSYKVNAERKVF